MQETHFIYLKLGGGGHVQHAYEVFCNFIFETLPTLKK